MIDVWLYTVDPLADEPIMLIDKHIGFDETDGFGIMGDVFQKELLALDGMNKKRIQVWINSPGGIVSDGYNIYNAILKSQTKVDTNCVGMAASIAGVIFQAGRNRTMADYAWLMYHDPYGGNDPDGLDVMRESLAKMVANRTGKTQDEVLAIMKQTSYIMADQALATGLCDKIESSEQYNKKRMVSTVEPSAFWKEANKIKNSLLNTSKMSFPKVANKLKLNSEASEDAILHEIDRMIDTQADTDGKLKAALTEVTNKGKSLEEKEKALADMTEKCKALAEEITQAKQKAAEEEKARAKAAEEEIEQKAKNMIEGFVTEGRIKNDPEVIKNWTVKAKADLVGVKALIEGLPLNKKAEGKLNVVTGAGNDVVKKPGSVVQAKMIELKLKQAL